MIETIQLRRDTAANWASVNPVLAQGEAGVETDTKKAKLGDGVTAWNSLAYWNPSGSSGGGGAVSSVFGRTGAVGATSGDYSVGQVTGAAPLASPALTGSPTAPTQTTGDNSTKLATDAFVTTAVAAETTRAEAAESANAGAVTAETSRAETAEALLAPKASPALTGTPTAPTASALTDSTQVATTAYADSAVAAETTRAEAAEALKLPLTGGTLTGSLTVGGALTTTPVTLTDAATVTVNAALSDFFRVTLGGNRTLGTPSNPSDGQQAVFEVIQPGSGGPWTLSYSGAYVFTASVPQPSLSTAAGDHDFISFTYSASESAWVCTGYVIAQFGALVTVAQGGTGQTTATLGFGALSPMTTLGDIIYENATPAGARLAGNTTGTKNYLTQTGNGTVSAAPAWGTIAAADLPAATTSVPGAVIIDGTAGDIQKVGTAAAAGAVGKPPDAGHVHLGFFGGIFGTGNDGSVTFDGSTTILGLVPSSSIYTLTRDIHCTSITVNNGVTVKTGNFRVFCRGTITNNGTVSNNGNNAVTSTGGVVSVSGSFGGGRAGGNGGTGVSGAGAAGTTATYGAASGAGGAGTSGSGGAAATPATSVATAQNNIFQTPVPALLGFGAFALNNAAVEFGASGGGGGSDSSSNAGGGGGGGGSVIGLFAYAAVNNGTISANGGNGAAGTAGNAGGGGGGAGGAILVYTLSAWTAGTATASAGTHGAGSGTGSNGSDGGAGLVLNVVLG